MLRFGIILFFVGVFVGSVLLTYFHLDIDTVRPQPPKLQPTYYTTSVPGDADDCAIWIHPSDPLHSTIIGNDQKPDGALYVWNLRGALVYKTPPLNNPGSVDVRHGVSIGTSTADIAACVISDTNEIVVFKINPITRRLERLTDPGQIPTYFPEGSHGFSLYVHPITKKLYAFVSRNVTDDIHQIWIRPNSEDGKLEGILVRSFGKKKIRNVVESIVVDDELGYLYCCDEREGVLKFYADPELKDNALIHKFATRDGIAGDREGITIYKKRGKRGYILLSDQEDHTIKVYKRNGNNEYITTIHKIGSTDTDGIAASSTPILPLFPKGIVVCHNNKNKNFAIYNWIPIGEYISYKQ